MPLRDEMTGMIAYIRTYGAASFDDTFNDETYWTDLQLQDILDRQAKHESILLRRYTATHWGLVCPRHIWFASDAFITDALETAYTGDFTYEAAFGEVEFAIAPLETDTLYITGLRVNMWEALAELWAIKAQQRYDYVNFKAGNNKMDMKTERDACEAQRDYYRNRTIRRYPRTTSRFA